jgi:hypothetical protein
MAQRIEAYTVTVPAGTAKTAPQTTVLAARDATLERVEVRVPPGPSGLVGFAFVHSGQQVIPWRDGDYVVTDDESLDWPVEGYPTGDKWALRAYNTDIYAHDLHLRLHFRELATAARAVLTLEAVVQTQATVAVE